MLLFKTKAVSKEMSDMAKKESNTSTEWKAQVERAERKARIARMKGSQGKKKKIGSHRIWKKVLLIAAACLLAIILVGWLVIRSGIVVRKVNALTVNGRQFSASDLNLNIGNMAVNAQLGLVFTEEFQETLMSPSPYAPDQTLRDLLIESAISQLEYFAATSADMVKAGFKPNDEQSKEIKEALDAYEKQMLQLSEQSGRSVTSILEMYYGPGTRLKSVQSNMEENMKISYYMNSIREAADISDESIEAYYDEHRDDYDIFSYYSYDFKPEDSALEGDALTKALDELEAKADAAGKSLTLKPFLEAVGDQLSEEDAKKLLEGEDTLLQRSKKATMLTTLFDFVNNNERKAGDYKVIRGTKYVTLVEFASREKDNFRPYSVRHILISKEGYDRSQELTQADYDLLKIEAMDVWEAFMDGEQTEDAFSQLAQEKSKDQGSASNGGLYANISSEQSAQFVKPFRDWCEDAARKPGDTGLVKTQFGYHVMYFQGHADEAELTNTIRETLRDEHVNAWSTAIMNEVKSERHPFGMKFVGRIHFFKALFSKEKPATEATSFGIN
jgi:parvulin-like peptidyl-prolyl isomerase